jgi:hypothetical protein
MLPSSVGIMEGNPAFDSDVASLAGSGSLGSLASGPSSNSNASEMADRLYYTRPRYASNDRTNRGTHAFIKLMTSSQQAGSYSDYSTSRADDNNQCSSSALSNALADMASGVSDSGYDKFLVTSVSAGMDEKVQVMEVFGDNEVAYYFGRAPMIFTISGSLIDSSDNGWFTQWLETYQGAFRGTQLAKNFEMLKLVLPNMILIGSMTNCNWQQTSDNDVNIPFSFQFLVKSLIPTPVTSMGTSMTNSAEQISFDAEQTFSTWSKINDLRTQGASIMGVLQNPMSTIGQLGSAMSGFGSGVSASLGLSGTSSSVSNFIDGITNSVSGGMGSLKGIFSSITSGLEGIRASIFSPIYGVMNSLTKLVKTVFGGGGLSSIFSALTAPIKNILGDITRIATQASAIAGMVASGISGLGRGVTSGFGLVQSYQSAVQAFKHAKGAIAAVPLTASNSVKNLFSSGNLSGSAPFLRSNPKHSFSRTPVIISTGSATLSLGASIKTTAAKISPQKAILSRGAAYTPTAEATL